MHCWLLEPPLVEQRVGGGALSARPRLLRGRRHRHSHGLERHLTEDGEAENRLGKWEGGGGRKSRICVVYYGCVYLYTGRTCVRSMFGDCLIALCIGRNDSE